MKTDKALDAILYAMAFGLITLVIALIFALGYDCGKMAERAKCGECWQALREVESIVQKSRKERMGIYSATETR